MTDILPTRTYGVKYIGSKNKVLPFIVQTVSSCITDEHSPSPTLIDVFAGTTRVSQAFRAMGWKVLASDLAWASETYAELFLRTTRDEYEQLRLLARELDQLGDEASRNGSDGDWITRSYCEAEPAVQSGDIVRVWKPHNGIRADTIRNTIDAWVLSGKITDVVGKKLVALLIMALDAVDSTVGVQQAYLKQWAPRASNTLCLEGRLPDSEWSVYGGPVGEFLSGDALVIDYPEADVAYVDPPYTTHSYATYYHIWDSIARWDKPEVGLKTNRRIDRVARGGCHDKSMMSDWNVKRKVVDAFCRLVERLPVRIVVISYSNEALVPIKDIVDSMDTLLCVKTCDIYSVDHKRNIMSNIGNGADPSNHRGVVEYLIVVHKEPSSSS